MRAEAAQRPGLHSARGSVAAAALSRSPLLASVSPGDLRALVRGAKARAFRARQVLFRRGDEPDGLYILVAGQVRVTIQEANGADLTLATFGVGEVLGELSVLDGRRRSATAVATTAVDALYVSVDDFRRWLTTHPDAAWHLLAGLARRMRATDEQIAEIALLDIETRIARRLWQQFTEVAGGQPSWRSFWARAIRLDESNLALDVDFVTGFATGSYDLFSAIKQCC